MIILPLSGVLQHNWSVESSPLAYKKTWRCPGKTHTKTIHILLFLFPAGDLCYAAELLDLAGSSPWHAPRWRVSGVSPSHCCREGCTRDGNKVSGQRNCVTARGRSTTFCAASTTICTASILHEDGTLIRKWNKILFEFVSACFVVSFLQLSNSIVVWILPQIEIWSF